MRKIEIGIATIILVLLAVSCGSGDNAATATPAVPACAPPTSGATVTAGSCWTMLKPLGSGGFPAEAGSNDRPLWEPGKIPVTMQAVRRLQRRLVDELSDFVVLLTRWAGLDEARQDRYRNRIWETTVFFDNYLWTFGGMEYTSHVLQNETWRSADGLTWEDVGTAAWSPRKSPAVVVYQDKL